MKIEIIDFHDISYEKQPVDENLKKSLLRIGPSFPIYVALEDDGYHCLDGHKRMNCIAEILNENPAYTKLKKLPCILKNHTRTAPPMHLRNHH